MKSIRYFTGILFLFIGWATLAQVSQNINFSINEVFTGQTNGLDWVKLENASLLYGQDFVGQPQLPVVSANLALPKGQKVNSVTVSSNQQTTLSGNFNLVKVQEPEELGFPKNESEYKNSSEGNLKSSTNLFPDDPLVNFTNHQYREYSYVTIRFIPFSYNEQTGKLDLITQVSISVNSSGADLAMLHSLRKNNPLEQKMRKSVKRKVRNKTDFQQFYAPLTTNSNGNNANTNEELFEGKFETSALPSKWGNAVPYVIITNNTTLGGEVVGNLVGKFQEFANWKTRKGIPAKVVTMDTILKTYKGVDPAAKVRNFIKDAYQNWGTENVLLGGTGSIVPVRWAYWHNWGVDLLATDLYYASLEGSWNANGNAIYGEGGDQADFTPDIRVGRAPVNTESEVDLFLKKNLTYARTITAPEPIPGGAWLGKTLLSMGEITSGGPGLKVGYDVIHNHHLQTDFYGMFEYDEELYNQNPGCGNFDYWGIAYYPLHSNCDYGVYIDSEDASHDGILTKIQEGYGLINVLDHGSPFRIGLGRKTHLEALTATDFEGLQVDNKYGILFATGCYTTPIDQDTYIGERWVNTPGGGVAYFGNSQSIGSFNGFNNTKSFFNQLFDNGIYKAGGLNNQMPDKNNSHKLAQLLGDPDLSIYTEEPSNALQINSLPNSLTLGHHDDVQITVSGLSNDEKALVSLYKPGEVSAYGHIATDTTFNITPDTEGWIYVTANAHNYEPFEDSIQVVQPANKVHLYHNNITVNDENGNGIIEPGEEINLSVQLRNTGGKNATAISAEMSSPDSEINFTQTHSTFPNINSDHTGISNNSYTFTAPQSDTIRAIPLKLTITSNDGEEVDAFILNVKSADLNLSNRQVTKNGNPAEVNSFSVGDEIHLKFTVRNEGQIEAQSVVGKLTPLDPNLATVTQNNNQNFGNIPANEEEESPQDYVINVEQSYSGGELKFNLKLTDDYGISKTFTVDLTEDFPDDINGFEYTATSSSITPTWNPIPQSQGYNLYRSDQENGAYSKVNQTIISGASTYEDLDVQPLSEYWYKVGVVTTTGYEKPLDELDAHKAETKINRHGIFPITVNPSSVKGAESSPIVYDVDGDGKKEIFVAFRNHDTNLEDHGRLFGFKESGEELYDIDGNATEVWGFAGTEKELYAQPTIGDLEGDGKAEILAVGRGHYVGNGHGSLYGFRSYDEDHDGFPDKLWPGQGGNIDLGSNSRIYESAVLADMNNDGYQEILVLDEHQTLHLFSHDGTELAAHQVGNQAYSLGGVAVADVDNDGFKEVFFGILKNEQGDGAIYMWDPDGDFTESPVLFHAFPNERADSAPVLADIDGDGYYEVLIITRDYLNGNSGNQGYAYALSTKPQHWGEPINTNWDGFQISLSNAGSSNIPRIAVGDLNNDGKLEVAFGSSEGNGNSHLYILDDQGNNFSNFPISGLNSFERKTPILADIDNDNEIEIIINNSYPSGGGGYGSIKAFKPNGSECVGWNLTPDRNQAFVSSPYIGDINGNGKNEVVIAVSGDEGSGIYVWDTEGDADKVEWGSYRHDAQNTGAYELAPCVFNPETGLDLMIKDKDDDIGNEPNNDSKEMWMGGDIWVRHQPDGKMNHETENPRYGQLNYVYVGVTNRGCAPFYNQGNDYVKVHWGKAGTDLGWPDLWNGNITSPALMGDLLGSKDIPDIPIGESAIIEFPWYPPNPDDYEGLGDAKQWHFCLLARIVSPQDPTTYPEQSGQNNAYLNNNISSRNVTVVNYGEIRDQLHPGGTIHIGNMTGYAPHTYDFVFKNFNQPDDQVWEEAEVVVTLDQITWEKWVAGGRQAHKIKLLDEQKHKMIIMGNDAKLQNLTYDRREWSTLNLSFNFLTQKVMGVKDFEYHIIQKETDSGNIIGGEAYIIKQKPRNLFTAQINSSTSQDSITLYAQSPGEPVVYNWYNADGDLIYSGKKITVSPDVAKKYKLEVIARKDGYKDYRKIEVQSPYGLDDLIPNPATNQVHVHYRVDKNGSAYLMITHAVSGVFNNYIIDAQQSQTTIDVSSYVTGSYIVSLVCDGKIIDSKHLLVK